eukprot:m.128917 g.128917  ORF g.128917 m.128917 type:complete len:789 (-) comp13881_c0_seq2:1673-4039(-)
MATQQRLRAMHAVRAVATASPSTVAAAWTRFSRACSPLVSIHRHQRVPGMQKRPLCLSVTHKFSNHRNGACGRLSVAGSTKHFSDTTNTSKMRSTKSFAEAALGQQHTMRFSNALVINIPCAWMGTARTKASNVSGRSRLHQATILPHLQHPKVDAYAMAKVALTLAKQSFLAMPVVEKGSYLAQFHVEELHCMFHALTHYNVTIASQLSTLFSHVIATSSRDPKDVQHIIDTLTQANGTVPAALYTVALERWCDSNCLSKAQRVGNAMRKTGVRAETLVAMHIARVNARFGKVHPIRQAIEKRNLSSVMFHPVRRRFVDDMWISLLIAGLVAEDMGAVEQALAVLETREATVPDTPTSSKSGARNAYGTQPLSSKTNLLQHKPKWTKSPKRDLDVDGDCLWQAEQMDVVLSDLQLTRILERLVSTRPNCATERVHAWTMARLETRQACCAWTSMMRIMGARRDVKGAERMLERAEAYIQEKVTEHKVESRADLVYYGGVVVPRSTIEPTYPPLQSCEVYLTGMYNELVSVYARNNRMEDAVSVLTRMAVQGHQPTCHTFDALLKAQALARNTQRAQAVFDSIASVGLTPTTSNWTNLVLAFCLSNDTAGCTATLQAMTRVHVTPTPFMYQMLVRFAGKRGQLADAKNVFDHLVEAGAVQPSAHLYAALLEAARVHNDAFGAEDLMKEMMANGITPNKHAWLSLAKVYHQADDMISVEDIVMRRMPEAGVSPHFVLSELQRFTAKLSKCADQQQSHTHSHHTNNGISNFSTASMGLDELRHTSRNDTP